MLADPAVEAVYIASPHPMHATAAAYAARRATRGLSFSAAQA